ncbi:hypothetical protein PLICRDRAFT_623556 [Plicaturopsis crispa FD-325 SS-3]|nr:hypothetical protein PLICRDRAFT_623556 [Plicaturopsis crispa FD-325 SS-3]
MQPTHSRARERDGSRHQVNNLLHTLRGEQFRHSQNVLRSRSHLSSASHSSTGPTLLSALDWLSTEDERASASRPEPPKSWTQPSHVASKEENDGSHSRTWRAEALSLVFSRPADEAHDTAYGSLDQEQPQRTIPPLTMMCLRILLSCWTDPEVGEEIVPYIPPHLRRDLLRHTAVNSPLPNSKLYPLCEPDGHANGEFIVIGPYASLRPNHFQATQQPRPETLSHDDDGASGDDSWDSYDETPPRPFSVLAIISTQLTVSTFLTFPPTLTHLALVNVPSTVPLHRLPGICPLLIVLDVSHNKWLTAASKGAEKLLAVDWSRWSRLSVVGLRECEVTSEILAKINKGRWNDIEVFR